MDIWGSPLHFTKNVFIDSPTYPHPTFAWPPRRCHTKVCRWIFKDIVCKVQCRVPNINGEEFHSVGRTILIRQKMSLFPYAIYINFFNLDCQKCLQCYNPLKSRHLLHIFLLLFLALQICALYFFLLLLI